MEFSGTFRRLLFACATLMSCRVSTASICGKFSIGGPCALLPTTTKSTTTTAGPLVDNSYCLLACAQQNDVIFGSLCNCAGMTTTTLATTTTPQPETCYYTRARTATLSPIVKRLYSPTNITTECQYPGVVGLYRNPGTADEKLQCMGTLLEENKILIDSYCLQLIQSTQTYVTVESYQQSSVSTSSPTVLPATAKALDPTGANKKLYTVSLNAPITFNEACIQPACVPNANIYSADIDFTDCRFVGYGDTTDVIGSTSPTLMELKVKVNTGSIAGGSLTYTRVDKLSSKTGPCFGDQGAPLICTHKVTGEWITVGVALAIGFKCSLGTYAAVTVASLLRESTVHNFYNGLQTFKYNPSS
ncbi:unnamed protein product [Lymnaea stagnalis]|uniref:Peptidase S1 domain-containing protein n=1 Tax=Lymnaea stagnalis TaxID=6523 RepID=A0AAV2I7C1_LYMST